MARVTAIAALGRKRELGRGNELLWTIPEDLKRFKTLTLGHPCIMGRKTFESIVGMIGKPLPGRTNIMITRDPAAIQIDGVVAVPSVEEAFEQARVCEGGDDIFIIGGAQIYAAALPYTDRLLLTLIDAEALDADAFFPEYESVFTHVSSDEVRVHEELRYRWIELQK